MHWRSLGATGREVVDDDALEEYWVEIRKHPERMGVRKVRARGKHNQDT